MNVSATIDRPERMRMVRPERKQLTSAQQRLALETFDALLNGDCRQLCVYLAGREICVEQLKLDKRDGA